MIGVDWDLVWTRWVDGVNEVKVREDGSGGWVFDIVETMGCGRGSKQS